MRHKLVIVSVWLALLDVTGPTAGGGPMDRPQVGRGQETDSARQHWLRQDLQMTAGAVLSNKVASGQHLLLCQEGFSMAVAGRQFTSGHGLVWITTGGGPADGDPNEGYQVQVYLGGRVSSRRIGGDPPGNVTEIVLERDRAMVVRMSMRGEVFITADKNETGDPRSSPLYERATTAFKRAGWDLPSLPARAVPAAKVEPNEPAVSYTINWAPLTEVAPKMEWTRTEAGQEIMTFIGRVYIWWQQSEQPNGMPEPYELEADTLVFWRRANGTASPEADPAGARVPGVSEIYVAGDVIFRQGQRTIYADEVYYDLQQRRALARNVVLRSFDAVRNVPIFVRAEVLRQVGADEFQAEDIIVTTSEFWAPQISLEAAWVRLTDRTPEAEPGAAAPEGIFELEAKKARFKYGSLTLLNLPTVRTGQGRPEVAVRSIRLGSDRAFGTSVETRWYLNRLLGLPEPVGTESTLALDYFDKRGPGGGVEVNYERENYFGSLLGYALHDQGEDRLSRTRKDIDVPEDTRGRFRLQHRHFLPHSWQLTAEVSYLSDQNFLEQFYRTEFNVGKEQETLLYLKRIEDNWGLAFLGKTRTNDFLDQVEELPSAEYHLTGQSLFDDRFTFFSDNQVSRYRYRISSENPRPVPDDFFTFAGTRNELDLPLTVGKAKVVPFVAGTVGYENGMGFQAGLDEAPIENEETIWLGEAGVRVSAPPYWCVYPEVQSRLWDLHQLRHVIRPGITAVAYAESDEVAQQRDTLDLEIAQRWQTKRGPAGNQRTVDWLELNVDFVWVDESSDEFAGTDRFVWNQPLIPLVNRSGRVIPPLDRRTTDQFGPRQNYTSTDGILRLTDTTAILGDAYFDMQTGVVEQADIGFSRLCWPDLGYYVGSRYLRRFVFNSEERSSSALVFAITYVLDPRYTLVFSEQYDFNIGANITTDVTLIRKYHRMNWALTFSADDSMDEQRVVFSLWPEGLAELAIGPGKYMQLGASDVYQ